MDFEIDSEASLWDKPGELRFVRNSSIFGKMSTAVRRANEKPEPDGLWFTLSSGARTRTWDLRVMSPTSCHCSTPRRLFSGRVLYHSHQPPSSKISRMLAQSSRVRFRQS